MRLDLKKHAFDVLTSIQSIDEYLGQNRTFEYYNSNKLIRRAIEREIEIIGEAVNNLLKLKPDLNISSARQIVNTRNIVIHAYDSVDNIVIWGIVIKHLPILKSEIETLLT